ncbi:sigma factor G inhibitor Gin [Numidum massiliense]|uniref:sigma factor G inhibitor Gin n=1 Tax=Numidum massiliense TaxID=1522315 RepID=UPI0006D5687A|nr:sigma factor G inhibitor Gin [Numidum massiliense]
MEHKDALNERQCIVCDHMKDSGITVCDQFICDSCEREMIKTDVKEAKYPLFVQRLRRIWLKDA